MIKTIAQLEAQVSQDAKTIFEIDLVTKWFQVNQVAAEHIRISLSEYSGYDAVSRPTSMDTLERFCAEKVKAEIPKLLHSLAEQRQRIMAKYEPLLNPSEAAND